MRELVLATIADQPDVEIVGEIPDGGEIAAVVERILPDVLVVALDGADRLPGECYGLFQRYPELRIVAIAPERESSLYCWATVNIHSVRMEVSEQGILHALRGRPRFVGDKT